jgi:hypothetical protein
MSNLDVSEPLENALIGLSLVKTMAAPDENDDPVTLMSEFTERELLLGVSQLTSLWIKLEARKAGITVSEYIDYMRRTLISISN